MAEWSASDIPGQLGRTAVVTGGDSGIGPAVATELARHGARVILAVRDVEAGRRVAERIPGRVEVRELDLASLPSVRRCAESLVVDLPRIDLLINNAGTAEPHLGAHLLGPFALTGLLFDTLGRADAARVVTVSSLTHRAAHLDFDDLMSENGVKPKAAYDRSKLAATVFGLELDRRLRTARSRVVSVLAHPGLARGDLGPWGFWAIRLIEVVLVQPPTAAALPSLYAATARDVQGGQFYGPAGPGQVRGGVTRVQPSPEAANSSVGTRLWAAAESLTDVRFP